MLQTALLYYIRIYISLSLRFAVQIYKAQRNVILCVSACLLYWYVWFGKCLIFYLHSCQVPLYVPAGVFIEYANTTRRFRVWRKWRRGTRTSNLSSAIHPHFISRGREVVMLYFVLNIDITSINMNIMYLQVPSLMHAGHVFLLALGYCIFSWERTERFTNTTGWKSAWKSALSIFDIVFVLIYQTFSFLVLHSPRVQSGK